MKRKKWMEKAAVSTLAYCMAGSLVLSALTPMKAAAAETQGNDWESVRDVVSRYKGEWTDQSYEGALTDRIPHTALLGNGDIGVASYGKEGEKTFLISKGDFWSYNDSPLPIGGVTIKEALAEIPENKNLTQKVEKVTASNYIESLKPERTIMGYTPGMEGWVTEPGKPQWIAYEFSEEVTIGEWILIGDGGSRGPGQQANNPKDFQLETSSDGENWTPVDVVTGNTEGVVDHHLVNPVTTKYLRFYFTTPTQESDPDSTYNPRARVAQVFFYEDNSMAAGADKGVNVAQSYSEIKASSVDADFRPERAVDGEFVYGTEGWVSQVEKNPWIALKFDEPAILGYYEIMGDSAIRSNGEAANNPSAFRVQISNDDSVWDSADGEWIDAAEIQDNTEGMITGTFSEPVEAKYVRFFFDQPVQSANEPNPRARIGRLELYSQAAPTAVDGDQSGIYEGSAPGNPQPDGAFHEQMNLDTANVATSMYIGQAQVEIDTWTAEGKNLLVSKLTSNSDQDVKLELNTWTKSDNPKYPARASQEDDGIYVMRQTENRGNAGYVSEAAMTTRVIGAEVEDQKIADNGAGGLQYVTLPAGQTIYVVTAVGGSGRTYQASDMSLIGEDPIVQTKAEADLLDSKEKAEEFRAEHEEWWKDFWCRSYMDLGTENEDLNRMQSYYYGSLYMLGSALREGKTASGLYGIWHTTDTPNWKGDFHLNYNFISAYYGLNSTNHSELTLPAAQALFDYVEEGRRRGEDTKQYERIVPNDQRAFLEQKIADGKIDAVNGIEGAILYPVGIGPWGITPDDNYHREGMNASYSIYPMIEYYEYTQDRDFLENYVYDYMKMCAAFYESWLTKEDTEGAEDGYTYNIYAGYNEGSWSKNPAVELGVVKNLFSSLIKYSSLLGKDADKQELWKDILTHLPAQPTVEVNGLPALSLAQEEWLNGQWSPMDTPIPQDGNAIPLDAMIPGNVFNHFSAPEDLQIVRNTIQTFVDNGNPWFQQNNFPRIFPEAVESGYDIETVVRNFVNVIKDKQQKNLAIDDGAHGIEKAGSIETVNQMLLNSENDMIKVFPNWLQGQDAEFHTFGAKGGFTVSAKYDGAAQEVSFIEVTSKNGNVCQVVDPWSNGDETEAEGYHDGTLISFQTEAGMTYKLVKGPDGAAVEDQNGNPVESTKGKIPYYSQMPAESDVPTDPDPDKPTDPDEPTDPDPDKPTDPDVPTDPDPDKPADPDEPTDPDPDKPADPDEPTDPDQDKPTDPDTPSKPNDPSNPDVPSKPNKPSNPDTPGQNGNVDRPNANGNQNTGKDNSQKTQDSGNKAAKTGDEASLVYPLCALILSAGIGAGAIYFNIRRKRKEQ